MSLNRDSSRRELFSRELYVMKDNYNGFEEVDEKQRHEHQQQQTPRQKIEPWLRRMADSNAELDIGPGIYSSLRLQ